MDIELAFYSEFAGHYEKVFPFRKTVSAFLHQRLPADGGILDIGCGSGGHCGQLATETRTCLGIDLDPEMIVAARKAQADNPACEFRVLDMAEIGTLSGNGFSGIFCLGNVLPHLPTAGLQDFLNSVGRLLPPGGIWIFQTVNFDPLLSLDRFDFPILDIPEDGLKFFRSYENISDESLVFSTRLEEKGVQLFSGNATLYPKTSDEYKDMHLAAGFRMIEHFGDFSGSPFVSKVRSGNVMVFGRG